MGDSFHPPRLRWGSVRFDCGIRLPAFVPRASGRRAPVSIGKTPSGA
jgi:hypothetical protein